MPTSWYVDAVSAPSFLLILVVLLLPPPLPSPQCSHRSASIGVDGKVFASQMSSNIVETQYGKLRGVLVTLPGGAGGGVGGRIGQQQPPQVEAYLGLQYASVLGGELRFMPPTSSLEKWDGIRVALKFRPVCPQRVPSEEQLRRRMPNGRVEHFKRLLPFLEKQSEECLNLNIYVPVRAGQTSSHIRVSDVLTVSRLFTLLRIYLV